MNLNQRTVKIELTRGELIDLILLCAVLDEGKWLKLHDKLREQAIKADENFSREE